MVKINKLHLIIKPGTESLDEHSNVWGEVNISSFLDKDLKHETKNLKHDIKQKRIVLTFYWHHPLFKVFLAPNI